MPAVYTIGFQGVGGGGEADRPRGNLNYPAARTHAKRTYSRLDDLRNIVFFPWAFELILRTSGTPYLERSSSAPT